MNKLIIIIVLTFIAASCRKKEQSPAEVVHFKGRLVEDCNLKPIPGIAIRIYQKGDWIQQGGDIGEGVSDANGFFDILCPGFNESLPVSLTGIIDENHQFLMLYDYDVARYSNKEDNTYDFGTYYAQFNTTTRIKITVTSDHGNADSLLIGTNTSDYKTVYPLKKGTYYVEFSGTSDGFTDSRIITNRFIWGIGKKDLDSAWYSILHSTKNGPFYHRLVDTAVACQTHELPFKLP